MKLQLGVASQPRYFALEHLENAKAMDRKGTIVSHGNNKKKPAKKKNGGNNSSNNSDSDNTYFCKVHGWNNSHTTKQCCRAKKLKAKGKPIKPQKCSPNKSWSCKSNEAKKTSKEELDTLVAQGASCKGDVPLCCSEEQEMLQQFQR
jgi:hypothetical protein